MLKGITSRILPPREPSLSKTTGSCPFIQSCQATESPAGPPPMTAIFTPVEVEGSGSPASRLAFPRRCVYGLQPLKDLVHPSMQRFGHKYPQTVAGNGLYFRARSTAFLTSPFLM